MSFGHMKTSVVKRSHGRALEALQLTIETTDDETEAKKRKVMRHVDGLPVHVQLANLCDAVRAMHRDIKFAVHRNGKTVWENGIAVPCEVWAYFEGDEYACMRLGYADYSVRYGDGSKFAVMARNIRNEKYNDSREQHYMATSDTLERAVKNVKKHLRRYTVAEMANMSFETFQSKVSSVGWTASSEYRDAFQFVTTHDSFANEMRSLVNGGHQFNDPIFGAAVKTMLEKLDTQMAKQYEAHHGYYVQVREYMGEQVFDVIAVLDVKKVRHGVVGPHKTYKADELDALDENLASRIAALSMLEDSAFVEGLGHKVNATSYWVLK